MTVSPTETIKTRSQQDLITAHQLISELASGADSEAEETKKIYGGLCHNFPVMILTCGLCQAVAFSTDKAASKDRARAQAHRLILEHAARILDLNGDLLPAVQKADAQTYIHYTRRLIAAWIYFKRFAVSILKVETGDHNGD